MSIVLCGGQATRMFPLSLGRSKAMLPFFGQPLLGYLIQDLVASGLRNILLTSRGSQDDIFDCIGDGSQSGARVRYTEPPQSPTSTIWTGSAGAVRLAITQHLCGDASPIVIVYGDSLLRLDYGKLLGFHRDVEAAMTIACHRPRLDAFLFDGGGRDRARTNFGVADLDASGQISRFVEKPCLDSIGEEFKNPVASAAVYVMEPSALLAVDPPERGSFDFGFHMIPSLIASGAKICGLDIAPGFRLDLGTLSHYLSAHLAALRGEPILSSIISASSSGLRISESADISSNAVLVPPVFVGPGVHVEEGAVIDCSVIGAGGNIEHGARVSESVVLEHANVGPEAVISGSIIGSHARVAGGAVLPRGSAVGPWSRIGDGDLLMSTGVIHGLLCGSGL